MDYDNIITKMSTLNFMDLMCDTDKPETDTAKLQVILPQMLGALKNLNILCSSLQSQINVLNTRLAILEG